jgi:hypothetical protein
MRKEELLPGVTSKGCPPAVICDAHAAIRRARVRAGFRDFLQVALVLAVDYLFAHWPRTRFPYLDRVESLAFLKGMNLVIIAELWLSRAVPKWWARRIATTWSRRERERFKA